MEEKIYKFVLRNGEFLAMTFGRSIFSKAHNPINIYDIKNDGGERIDVLSLSLNKN